MYCREIPTGLRSVAFKDTSLNMQINEKLRVENCLPKERNWMKQSGLIPYIGRTQLVAAIETGELVEVSESNDLPYRQHLQNRLNVDVIKELPEEMCSVPYLRPRALKVLHWVAAAARESNDSDEKVDFFHKNDISSLRYAVTSMTRTRHYQRELNRAGKLATDSGDSTHSFGYAFDIDHAGYYVTLGSQPELGTLPVNYNSNPHLYSDLPIHSLQQVLEAARDKEILNYITELPTGRGCWHVAANPFNSLALDISLKESFPTAAAA